MINTLRFRLTAPSTQQSDWVDEAHPTLKGRLSGGGPFRMELVKRHPDNGDSRGLVIELGTGPGLNLLAEGDSVLEIEAVKVRTAAGGACLAGTRRCPSVRVRHPCQ